MMLLSRLSWEVLYCEVLLAHMTIIQGNICDCSMTS